MSFGSSDSENRTYNTSNQSTSNEQNALQDFEGIGLQGIDGNVRIENLSDEAIEYALDFGGEAVFATADSFNRFADVQGQITNDALNAMRDVSGDALDFGGEVVFSNENVTRAALDANASVLDGILAFADKVVTGATNAVTTTAKETVNSAVDFTRSDNAASLETLTKYGFGAVALILIGVAYFATRKQS